MTERRGASAKRVLSKEVASSSPSNHSSILPFIHPSVPYSFIGSWINASLVHYVHWFADSLIHEFIRSFSHLVNRFVDSLTSSPMHWFIDSLNHRITGSLIHWISVSLIQRFVLLIVPLNQRFSASLIHFIESSIHCFIDSLIRWFVGSLIHWFIGSSVRFPIGRWFPKTHFRFSNLPLRRGPGTILHTHTHTHTYSLYIYIFFICTDNHTYI